MVLLPAVRATILRHAASMRPTVLLFDIDGTLVTTPGVGRRALEQAFAARYGRSGVLDGMQFGGMTDRALARAALGLAGEPTEGLGAEAAIDAILPDDSRSESPGEPGSIRASPSRYSSYRRRRRAGSR